MELSSVIGWLEEHKRNLDGIQQRCRPPAATLAQNFGPWSDHQPLIQAATNLRTAAQLVNHETTKLSLVLSSTNDVAAVSSILEEYKVALEKLIAHYLSVCAQAAGSATLTTATKKTRAIVYAVLRLLQLLADGKASEVPSATGVVWKMCEDMQKMPLSNKIAYRRAILEHLAASKDTNQEFAQYLKMSEATGDLDIGHNEGDDEFGEEEADSYNSEELPVAVTAIDALKLCTTVLASALEIVSDVGNRTTDSSVPSTDQTETQKWTEECHQLAARVESALTDLGAELYPPIDIEIVGELLTPALDAVEQLSQTLIGELVHPEETPDEQKSDAHTSRPFLKDALTDEQLDTVTSCINSTHDIAEQFKSLSSSG